MDGDQNAAARLKAAKFSLRQTNWKSDILTSPAAGTYHVLKDFPRCPLQQQGLQLLQTKQ